jgi:hypothetical protein
MKRLLRAAAALLCAIGLSAFGQGVRYDNRIATVASNVPFGADAPVLAIPNAIVTICTASGCPNPASIFSNVSLTTPISNVIKTDTQGRFGFWAASGNYFYQVQLPNGTIVGTYPITLGGTGGGGLITAAETPSGTINGSNHVFTLSNAPTLLLLDLNGLLMTQGVDYTLSGNTITFTASLPYTGDRLFANYFYGSGSLTPFSQTPTGVINGSNTAFTLTHSPQILFLTRNGVQLVVGTDYTLSGTNLTMTAAPQTGDIFNAQYFY